MAHSRTIKTETSNIHCHRTNRTIQLPITNNRTGKRVQWTLTLYLNAAAQLSRCSCVEHIYRLSCGKMVRTEAKSKRAKKSTQNNFKASNILPSVRITRSKSLQTEIVQIAAKSPVQKLSKVAVKNCFTLETRSKSKANISQHNTRSKSKNIENIIISKDSTEQQPQNLDNKSKTQTKSLSLSKIQFVKLDDFKVDSIVLAKQKYSVPWPSKVLKIEKNRVFVYFFGDKRSGYVPKSDIYDFILSTNAIKSIIASKKNHQSYSTGIAEVEMLMGIPSDFSALN